MKYENDIEGQIKVCFYNVLEVLYFHAPIFYLNKKKKFFDYLT